MDSHAISVIIGVICLVSVVVGLYAGYREYPGSGMDIVGTVFMTTIMSALILGLLFLGQLGITGQLV